MCGIAGFLGRWPGGPAGQAEAIALRMASTMSHRGPDWRGAWADESAGVAFGHARLAILDVTPTGNQPMHSESGRYVITYNGEIYNHRRIRSELEADGHRFKGTSDTEVVLEAFTEWGIPRSLSKFVGMFAFGLWDRKERALVLARDRLGEKPLYYGWSGNHFLFGSELKAFRAHPAWSGEVDRDVLTLYFRYNYVPAPYSIYKGVFKLLPGTLLEVRADGTEPGAVPDPVPYWSLRAVAEQGDRERFGGSDDEAVERLDGILKEVVSGQMISDVPLGAFLSGGVDSSTVVALMQAQTVRPVRTFTIGFDDVAFNEAGYAKEVAKHIGTEHTELYVSPKDALDTIPRLPALYDEPFADSSQIPTVLLSNLTRRHVTVSLSGDGGDEVFCGYNRQVLLSAVWARSRRVPKPLREALAAMLRAIPLSWSEAFLRRKKYGVLSEQVQKLASVLMLDDLDQMYLRLRYFWDDPTTLVPDSSEPDTLLSTPAQWASLSNFLERSLYLETMTSLPDDMLVKVDRAAMGVGLETRLPLLDHRVVEFAWELPRSMKVRDGAGKWILRQVLYRYVPRTLIERPKSGFAVPIDVWLKGPLRDWAEGLLNETRLRREGYLTPPPIRVRWAEHLNGTRKWHYHLWGILMFQAWLENERACAFSSSSNSG